MKIIQMNYGIVKCILPLTLSLLHLPLTVTGLRIIGRSVLLLEHCSLS